VPETAAFRVDLKPSRRARWLRVLAQVLCAVATLVCATALVVEPTAERTVAALLAAAALLVTLRPRAHRDLPRLGVGADGRVYVGAAADGTSAAAAMCYVGEGCVCLQTSGGRQLIWPDQLPAGAWRRLRVAGLWQAGADGAASAPDGDRTK
jgi:hypothetical protein